MNPPSRLLTSAQPLSNGSSGTTTGPATPPRPGVNVCGNDRLGVLDGDAPAHPATADPNVGKTESVGVARTRYLAASHQHGTEMGRPTLRGGRCGGRRRAGHHPCAEAHQGGCRDSKESSGSAHGRAPFPGAVGLAADRCRQHRAARGARQPLRSELPRSLHPRPEPRQPTFAVPRRATVTRRCCPGDSGTARDLQPSGSAHNPRAVECPTGSVHAGPGRGADTANVAGDSTRRRSGAGPDSGRHSSHQWTTRR